MAERLKAAEVRRRVGAGAMLVCAYDDVGKCRKTGVTESIPYPEFKDQLDSVPKSQEIVFFCA